VTGIAHCRFTGRSTNELARVPTLSATLPARPALTKRVPASDRTAVVADMWVASACGMLFDGKLAGYSPFTVASANSV